MEIKELIGRRIKYLRKSKGMSQEELAEKMGINPKYLSSIERGKENPTLDTFIKLTSTLNIDISEPFSCTHEQSPKELKMIISDLVKGNDKEKLKLLAKIAKAINI